MVVPRRQRRGKRAVLHVKERHGVVDDDFGPRTEGRRAQGFGEQAVERGSGKQAPAVTYNALSAQLHRACRRESWSEGSRRIRRGDARWQLKPTCDLAPLDPVCPKRLAKLGSAMTPSGREGVDVVKVGHGLDRYPISELLG
jgi:hypothetical protein